jgi:hypothetical protein
LAKKKRNAKSMPANLPPVPKSGPSPQPVPNVPPAEKPRLHALLSTLEQARGHPTIVYWTGQQAKISEAAVVPLYDQLKAVGHQEELDLVLFTGGGDTEAPWRIVSLIREFCTRFSVLIPHRAHSAGTLLALGADEIVMTPLAVLGPIDPQRTHPLLPRREGAEEPEPISVQDMRHAMQFIREAAGQGVEMPYTPDAMAHIFGALFEKIHPLAIGAIEQSYALSKLVATRCLGTHMDPVQDAPQIKAIVDKLCDEYKSHSYEISRREAREIGLKALDAPPPVETALEDILKFYMSRVWTPTAPPKSGTFQMHLAWLDSLRITMRVEATFQMDGDQAKLLGDQWLAY